MVLDYLHGLGFLSHDEYEYLNNTLVHGVDEQDNGRFFSKEGFCSFSDIIKIYNPLEEGGNTDKNFSLLSVCNRFTNSFAREVLL